MPDGLPGFSGRCQCWPGDIHAGDTFQCLIFFDGSRGILGVVEPGRGGLRYCSLEMEKMVRLWLCGRHRRSHVAEPYIWRCTLCTPRAGPDRPPDRFGASILEANGIIPAPNT